MEANTCSICKHSYNISTKKPLVLPCSHIFCQECLQKGEATENQECLACRKTWGGVRVADLPSRYQVIPVEGQSVKGQIQEADSDAVPHDDICDEHNDKYFFWCESCDVPSCNKCLTLKHKGCEFVLIDDKHKLRKQEEAALSSLKEKQSKHTRELTLNKEELICIHSFIEKLESVEREMTMYNSKVYNWQDKAEEILSAHKVPRSRIISQNKTQPDNWSVLDELEKKIGSPPSSFLMHVASAYQSSSEDVDSFISVLKSCVAAHPVHDESLAAKVDDLSIAEAVTTLTEGGNWVISNTTSAAAAQRVMQTTSIRPKMLQVDWKNMPENMIANLQTFIYPRKSYQVEAIEVMKCFPHSTSPCTESRSSTTVRLNAWIRPAGWAALTQFWGHLDATAIQKLPVSIKSLGLVLREQRDMEAVNMLCGTAFGRVYQPYDRSRLKWTGWTDLHLSLAKTFRPEHWMMTWRWEVEDKRPDVTNSNTRYVISHTPKSTALSLSTALPALGVGLRLYLPQLLPGDRQWMGDLLGVMKLGMLCGPLPLFLHDVRIDLDPLLGVLRDSGQRWDVHLPASLTDMGQRKEVAERYKKCNHSVSWDLE